MHQRIRKNTDIALDQTDYQKRYDGFVGHLDKAGTLSPFYGHHNLSASLNNLS